MTELETIRTTEQSSYETGLKPSVLVLAHMYDPHRRIQNLAPDAPVGDRVYIATEYPEPIYQSSYVRLGEEPPPGEDFAGMRPFMDGFITSIYGTLRGWWKFYHPEGFARMRQNILDRPSPEWRILGDPAIHAIMPLLPEADQDTLVKIGKRAFVEDLGFEPEGFWLPETAVSGTSLRVLYKNGYKFVALRDDQLESHEHNPMFVKVHENGQELGEIAIVHGDAGLSGAVSFQDDVTANADQFLDNRAGGNIALMSDAELYNWHKKDKDQFLYYLLKQETMARHGYVPFNIQAEMANPNRNYTTVKDKSSWSCCHECGRWIGTCHCGAENGQLLSDRVISEKKYLRESLRGLGETITEALDRRYPAWRDDFVRFFLRVRQSMYIVGDVNEDISKLIVEGIVSLKDPVIVDLFKANLARLTGETSCAWFFGEDIRPERQIAYVNINAANSLLQKYDISPIVA